MEMVLVYEGARLLGLLWCLFWFSCVCMVLSMEWNLWRIGIKSINFVKLSPFFHFIIFIKKVMMYVHCT
jgi:hypothetical protein